MALKCCNNHLPLDMRSKLESPLLGTANTTFFFESSCIGPCQNAEFICIFEKYLLRFMELNILHMYGTDRLEDLKGRTKNQTENEADTAAKVDFFPFLN